MGRQQQREGRKPLFKCISAAMEVAEASARACKRRVTDGINHRCDRVRGGERGRRAVTDGAQCRCWRGGGGGRGGGL